MKIDLTDFVRNVRDYQISPYAVENLYNDTLSRRDIWDNLAQIDEQKTEDVVLYFLNAWKCRVAYACSSDLSEALRVSAPFLANFKHLSLESVPLKFLIEDSNVQQVFLTISSVKAKKRTVGATATSKILHMINPSFFMMADENTRYAYGCSDNELGYANFMWRMKLFVDALTEQYSRAKGIPKAKVLQDLALECQSRAKTLTKLIDEYNWVKYNPK